LKFRTIITPTPTLPSRGIRGGAFPDGNWVTKIVRANKDLSTNSVEKLWKRLGMG
jgi:hypothetical protein